MFRQNYLAPHYELWAVLKIALFIASLLEVVSKAHRAVILSEAKYLNH